MIHNKKHNFLQYKIKAICFNSNEQGKLTTPTHKKENFLNQTRERGSFNKIFVNLIAALCTLHTMYSVQLSNFLRLYEYSLDSWPNFTGGPVSCEDFCLLCSLYVHTLSKSTYLNSCTVQNILHFRDFLLERGITFQTLS